MIPRFIRILWLCLLCAVPAWADDGAVLVISIDALHPAALSEKTSPTLYALMQAGRYTLQGRSVDPPQTLIAHTAMLTGLSPAQNGKQDNDWQPGAPRVTKATLFDDAKRSGYRTAFHYAKPKLGYLVSAAMDEHSLAPDDGIDKVAAFFRNDGRRMAFLHVARTCRRGVGLAVVRLPRRTGAAARGHLEHYRAAGSGARHVAIDRRTISIGSPYHQRRLSAFSATMSA